MNQILLKLNPPGVPWMLNAHSLTWMMREKISRSDRTAAADGPLWRTDADEDDPAATFCAMRRAVAARRLVVISLESVSCMNVPGFPEAGFWRRQAL